MSKQTKITGHDILQLVLTVIGIVLLIRLIVFVFKVLLNFDPANLAQRFDSMGLRGWIIQILILLVAGGLYISSRHSSKPKKVTYYIPAESFAIVLMNEKQNSSQT